MAKRYAGHATALVFEDRDGKRRTKKIEQLLWGDEIDQKDETDGDFVRVFFRQGDGRRPTFGWMKRNAIQKKPVLQVTFIDIGQGDGSVVVTPKGQKIVIDAGEDDNMKRYLNWLLAFPGEKRKRKVHAAVISHPDKDHYFGFDDIFQMDGVTFENVYHNGLVERKGKRSETLGPLADGKPKVYTDLVKDTKRLKELLAADARKPGKKFYPDMLRAGLAARKFTNFQMLSRDDGFVPGFEANKDVTIEVLGPIVETNDKGKTGLRKLGAPGVTKNGHSVVLRLIYGNVRVLLGGDLNIPSEKLLLETLSGGKPLPKTDKKRTAYLDEVRKLIEVDVAKSCHHGSADFSALFLEAVNPIATVISSGDDEGHSHPRAETIGAIGVSSRGERPLVYSTELARSVKETVRNSRDAQREFKRLHKQVLNEKDPRKRKALEAAFNKHVDENIQRTVKTYGAIYLRTDGEKAVIGHKFERNSAGKKWDLCRLDPDEDGRLHFHS